MTFHTTNTSTPARWVAGFVVAAGLGAALVTAVASADTNGTTTNAPGSTTGTIVGPVSDGVSTRNLQEQVGVKKSATQTPPPPLSTSGIDGEFQDKDHK